MVIAYEFKLFYAKFSLWVRSEGLLSGAELYILQNTVVNTILRF